MFDDSFVTDYRHHAYRPPQRGMGWLGLVVVVCVSSLLYAVIGPVGAGEVPTPIMEVKLAELRIEMPITAPPGPVIFSVTNAGTMEHNFAVKVGDIEKKFDANLKPGETRSLEVELPAGTHMVYCPLDNHKELGMQVELTVAQQRADGIAPVKHTVSQLLSPGHE